MKSHLICLFSAWVTASHAEWDEGETKRGREKGGGRRLSVSYNNNCHFQHTTHNTHTHSTARHSYISPIQNHSIHTHKLNTHTVPTLHTHTLTPHLHSIHTRTPSPSQSPSQSHNTRHPHNTKNTHNTHNTQHLPPLAPIQLTLFGVKHKKWIA